MVCGVLGGSDVGEQAVATAHVVANKTTTAAAGERVTSGETSVPEKGDGRYAAL
jgi:hypothetical protein